MVSQKRTDKQCSCEYCGVVFYTGHRRRFCNEGCRRNARVSKRPGAACPLARPCKTCGEVFTPRRGSAGTGVTHNLDAKYCSDRCRKKGNHGGKKPVQSICDQCGREFVYGGRPRKFCSQACRIFARSVSVAIHCMRCKYCGASKWVSELPADSAEFEHCCAKCYRDSIPQKVAHRLSSSKHIESCRVCGVLFCRLYGSKRNACSDQCYAEGLRIKRRAAKARCGSSARARARAAGVFYQPVNVWHVFERDNWTCQICGRKTPKRYRGSYKSNAPELDHRVPLSLGGPHTYDNVQCCCRRCNITKGNTSSAGQLPLFDVMA